MKLARRFGILFVLWTMMIPLTSKADHLAGAQITYLCLGGNSYRVTLTFYRDCSGISAPASALATFNCSSNPNLDFTILLLPVPGTGAEVTNACSAIPTACAPGGSGYGLQEYVYTAVVTLAPCNEWTISHSMCCRNLSNTIQYPVTSDAYFEAKLNNSDAPCNNSPQFTNLPVTITCVGQTWCYNHGAIDPDGDSLSYTLVAPWKLGPGTTAPYVTYIPPYTASQPLPSTPPVTMNAVTGDICMTPTQLIIAPIAVLVEEWREINGVVTKVGHVYRDMQVNVVSCVNNLPVIGGMDFTLNNGYSPLDSIYYHEMCLGPTISFNIWGYDADTFNPSVIGNPEIFNIQWNQGIPNGIFTVFNNNTDSAYANFSWTPTVADLGSTPRCFTVSVTDEACPYKGSQTFSYCIVVTGSEVDLGSDTVLCAGENFDITAIADSTALNYIWKIDGNPSGIPMIDSSMTFNSSNYSNGLHYVSIEVNDGNATTVCPGVDTVWVKVVDQPQVQLPNDTAFCWGGTITLDAGLGGRYQWNTGDTTQFFIVDTTGTYFVYVDGNESQPSHCNDADTIEVNVIPYPVVDLGVDTCSDVSPVYLFAGNDPNIYNYIWTDGLGNYVGNSMLIAVTYSSEYHVEVSGKANASCKDVGTRLVNILTGDKISTQVNGIDLGFGDQTICPHQEVLLIGPEAPTGHTYDYLWSVDGNYSGTSAQLQLGLLSYGDHIIGLDVGNGCFGEIKLTVDYCPLDIPNVVTPDGNGINDVFQIGGLEAYPGSQLIIYNRWGKAIFQSTNYGVGSEWNPIDQADGVYYYIFKVADGLNTEMSGTVTVIRK